MSEAYPIVSRARLNSAVLSLYDYINVMEDVFGKKIAKAIRIDDASRFKQASIAAIQIPDEKKLDGGILSSFNYRGIHFSHFEEIQKE